MNITPADFNHSVCQRQGTMNLTNIKREEHLKMPCPTSFDIEDGGNAIRCSRSGETSRIKEEVAGVWNPTVAQMGLIPHSKLRRVELACLPLPSHPLFELNGKS